MVYCDHETKRNHTTATKDKKKKKKHYWLPSPIHSLIASAAGAYIIAKRTKTDERNAETHRTSSDAFKERKKNIELQDTIDCATASDRDYLLLGTHKKNPHWHFRRLRIRLHSICCFVRSTCECIEMILWNLCERLAFQFCFSSCRIDYAFRTGADKKNNSTQKNCVWSSFLSLERTVSVRTRDDHVDVHNIRTTFSQRQMCNLISHYYRDCFITYELPKINILMMIQ